MYPSVTRLRYKPTVGMFRLRLEVTVQAVVGTLYFDKYFSAPAGRGWPRRLKSASVRVSSLGDASS